MIERAKKHIYHGDGKGKTTAAVGLCARACCYGNRILFCSFLKNDTAGEMKSLKKLGIATEAVAGRDFTWNLTESEMSQLRIKITDFFISLESKANDFNMIILDEVLDAVDLSLLPENLLIDFLDSHPDIEIVMTGRNPSASVIALSDYVTEMKMQKHPFNDKVSAREGIEM